MKRASLILAAAGTLLAAFAALAPAQAHAAQIKFSGMHPIPDKIEGDFCYIEVPHVHIYEPEKADVLYRVEDDHHDFVGDPVAFGYEGPKHSYYGHHPVPVNVNIDVDVYAPTVHYCYLDGPHYHEYEPPADIKFDLKGGAYWYIGKFPPAYHKPKKQYIVINIIYKPIVYVRPIVIVDAPPPGYYGPFVDVHVDAPVAEVHAPPAKAHIEAGIELRVPTIDVHVGVPGIVVGGEVHHHHHHRHKKHKKHRKHRGWH